MHLYYPSTFTPYPPPTPPKKKKKEKKAQLTFNLNVRNAEAVSLNGFIRIKSNRDLIGAWRQRELGIYHAAMCSNGGCEARSCVCYLKTKSEMHWHNENGTLDIPKEKYFKKFLFYIEIC